MNDRNGHTASVRELEKKLREKEETINRIRQELLMQQEENRTQNDVIETQRDVAFRQRDHITLQKKEITSSITYAQRIQEALLTKEERFGVHFADHFILYLPKDIVSGDFYWMLEKKDKIVVAAADSTGHGVPGAFMSLMGIVFLNEIVEGLGIVQPNRILNLMREKIVKSLGATGKENEPSDGIDMALISIDRDRGFLQYSGAFSSIYIIREGELHELKPDRMPLGFTPKNPLPPFTNHEFHFKPNDRVYLFSDGYADQFGWRNNRKLLTKNFKSLLLEIQDIPMKAQRVLLVNHLDNWKGDLEQVDDILVMGLQL